MQKYIVIRDTREQQGWEFSPSELCGGTVIDTLKTGDYTLEQLKAVLCIERKGSTGEIAKNIVQKRFDDELERMEAFQFAFVVCEFTWDDIFSFPENSGIPRQQWSKLRVSKHFIVKRLIEFELQYKTKIILAGKVGKEVVSSIFKRVIEWHQKQE